MASLLHPLLHRSRHQHAPGDSRNADLARRALLPLEGSDTTTAWPCAITRQGHSQCPCVQPPRSLTLCSLAAHEAGGPTCGRSTGYACRLGWLLGVSWRVGPSRAFAARHCPSATRTSFATSASDEPGRRKCSPTSWRRAGGLTREQLPVPGAEEIMAGFIRRFGGHDATRVARTAIEVAACQQRDDLVPDQIVFDLLIPVVAAGGGYILDGFPSDPAAGHHGRRTRRAAGPNPRCRRISACA